MAPRRLNGVQQGQVNIDLLQNYLESLEESGAPIPRRGSEPNRAEIASKAGIKRNVLYTNPRCKELLEEFDKADRERHFTQFEQAGMVREKRDRATVVERQLHKRVLVLEAENASLERELAKYRAIDRLARKTGNFPS